MWHCVISGGVIARQSARNCFKYYKLWYAVRFAWCHEGKFRNSTFSIFSQLRPSACQIASRRLTATRGGGVANDWRWLCLHANHWHCLWEIPPIIAVKSNVTTFIQVLRFVVDMFYCGRVAFTVFKHADIKGTRQRITSTTSLDDGYCEATISVVKHVKGHHVT